MKKEITIFYAKKPINDFMDKCDLKGDKKVYYSFVVTANVTGDFEETVKKIYAAESEELFPAAIYCKDDDAFYVPKGVEILSNGSKEVFVKNNRVELSYD